MRDRDLAALEFPRVCACVADLAASTAGKEACLALRPLPGRDAAEHELERAWQCFRLIEEHEEPPLSSFPDIRPHLRSAAHEGFVLDGKALVEIRTVLATARLAGSFFRRHAANTPALADLREQIRTCPGLESALTRALDDDGGMRDEASDELARIRQTARDLRDSLTQRLEDLVHRRGMADIVGDEYVTLRNNRFVVPIRAGAAGRFSGVVQDRSISGETLFVEPMFAVEMNNQLLMATRDEEAIIRRILADLTDLVRADHDTIESSFAALAVADQLRARARFARAYRCVQPAFNTRAVDLRDARHPGLLFTGRPVTPVDILLEEGKRVLVITGPNTGGKTVALKTLGLCVLMAQSGLLIPAAEGAQLPYASDVFTDIGDEQNIERDLSTFSAHVANLRKIFSGLGRRGSGVGGDRETEDETALVLLDEPGVGTDPEEGAALAVGLIQEIEACGARAALTTHYTPVKAFALGDERCTVAAVDFDLETLTPLYRLVYHSLGRSLALPIAERLGLPAAVLAAARAALSQAARAWEAALDRIETSRRSLEERLAQVKERSAKLTEQEESARRLLAELRERRRTAWQDELREARQFLRNIKEEGREILATLRRGSADRTELDRFGRAQEAAVAQRELEVSGEPAPAAPSGVVSVGDLVEVADHGIRGQLLSIDGERAWIQRGSLRFEVPASQLRAAGRVAPTPMRVELAHDEEEAAQELNLIGLRAKEAIEELRRFLDHAVLARHPSVRIIHGLGSGALRRAVREYLRDSPYCDSFRGGESGEGGEGVTIAALEV